MTRATRAEIYAGLMSGTSLDGVDAVLVDFSQTPARLIGHQFLAYPAEIRHAAAELTAPGIDELHRSARLAFTLAELYAEATLALLSRTGVHAKDVRALGCHGQTVRHRPEQGYSLQLVNAAHLVESTGICVVTDFRSRDIAAGGQGAPLVPAFHRALFHDRSIARVIVNIGGIANLTHLPTSGKVIGFDTGPGNGLLDLWIGRHLGEHCDRDGALAARGRVDEPCLARLLADDYFNRAPPKSTGRDDFNWAWLERTGVTALDVADGQATLASLTARSIAQAVRQVCGPAGGVDEILLCGGGVYNLDLVRRIEQLLAPCAVRTTAALGISPDHVEAFAFAWLARCTLQGASGNLPAVTGARGERVLGAIYPV